MSSAILFCSCEREPPRRKVVASCSCRNRRPNVLCCHAKQFAFSSQHSLPGLLLFSRVSSRFLQSQQSTYSFLIVFQSDTKFVARRDLPVSSPTRPGNFLSEFASLSPAERLHSVLPSRAVGAGLIAITECCTRSRIHRRQSSEFTPRYLTQPANNIPTPRPTWHSSRVSLLSEMFDPNNLHNE